MFYGKVASNLNESRQELVLLIAGAMWLHPCRGGGWRAAFQCCCLLLSILFFNIKKIEKSLPLKFVFLPNLISIPK